MCWFCNFFVVVLFCEFFIAENCKEGKATLKALLLGIQGRSKTHIFVIKSYHLKISCIKDWDTLYYVASQKHSYHNVKKYCIFHWEGYVCSAAGKKQIDIWSLFLIKGVLLVMLFDSYILGLTALNQLNSHWTALNTWYCNQFNNPWRQ